MKFADRLEARGWQGHVVDFKQIVHDMFAEMFPDMTDEHVTHRPTKCAIPFVRAVVKKTGITGTTTQLESLVLDILANLRKNTKALP